MKIIVSLFALIVFGVLSFHAGEKRGWRLRGEAEASQVVYECSDNTVEWKKCPDGILTSRFVRAVRFGGESTYSYYSFDPTPTSERK